MMHKRQKTSATGYAGWLPTPSADDRGKVESLSAGDIDPTVFWRHYVSQRKPVILNGHPQGISHLQQLWTDKHLTAVAGDTKVDVEVRNDAKDVFGRGRRKSTTFANVLQSIAAGNDQIYLTTQDLPLGPDGHPEIWSLPTSLLAADLPLSPSLLSNLVPQSINIWMGHAPEGSTTGLHHDYHDNLYVLLRGKKRFRLYPPSDVYKMPTVGAVAGVHANGRIVYKGQGDVLADGSDAGEVRDWKLKKDAEMELAAAEEALAAGIKGAKKRLDAAERALDAILDAALDIDDFHDDFDDFEQRPTSATTSKGGQISTSEPESFCDIDLSLPQSKIRAKYPFFPGVSAALTAEVAAGQCLYLPAGWFHEVTSFDDVASTQQHGHLALNYWFHPPDNLDPSTAGFEQPYSSEFWREVWAAREPRYKRYQANLRQSNGARTEQAQQGGIREDVLQFGADKGEKSGATAEQGRKRRERQPSAEEKAIAMRHVRGLFGYGRRHHLHRFIGFRAKRSNDDGS